MEKVIEKLKQKNKTMSTMESCTGGYLANTITNIKDSSQTFKFGAVTYSNEFKIKMGVSEDIIKKFSVYSIETAIEMSKNISDYANSDYGVGITGKLNNEDELNLQSEINRVYISIYDKKLTKFYNYDIKVTKNTRKENKEEIIKFIKEKLLEIL